ncbi:hypothetical protein BZA70DRAFT_4151 [Myxozyma melibiosi]|uniref:Uncharacterized protein n=1 Tax=Myxozyma melibiosi TaxID=54550 RepID=A0ABR1FBG7_9ASCO
MATTPSEEEIRAWRERLFSVEDEILMTAEEYDTFFPYMENVYKIHGRSTNSKDAVRTQTSYYQCRIDVNATQRGRHKKEQNSREKDLDQNKSESEQAARKESENNAESSNIQQQQHADENIDSASQQPEQQHQRQDSLNDDDVTSPQVVVDPAVVASSDEYVAALLAATTPQKDLSTSDHASSSSKRTRHRRPRETLLCPMKIKIVRHLDRDWNPAHYSISRTGEAGHSHDLALSDRIVKNNKVLALFDPDQLVERMRLSARERRARDLDNALTSIRNRYNELESTLSENFPDDKKRLDTTMRKWIGELQRLTDDLVSAPLDAFYYS